ncbi:hypothetical protein [Massilia yuzhufengensis]|uniref:Uncharacterized protein n=1 Tax=Massilia yuzhufengensis TaxID=1164594 RepID=A0A1I1QFI9_9BURK|nr:hypothetical protein [Massilia yuzhufengensis]SFD20924.1 hypothetical protein SAMN05216204_11918 [Massilia yuzhufengensis]
MIDLPGGELVVAYHGCDFHVATSIIGAESDTFLHLRPSKNPYDWLGDGIYFFEDDFERAWQFARSSAENAAKQYSAKPIEIPYVLGAVIRLGNCLDLSKQSGIVEFKAAFEELEAGRQEDQVLPVNRAAGPDDDEMILRNLDRAVINYIHGKRIKESKAPYDSVRGYFHQGKLAFATSAIGQLSHVQIAMRNAACILGYFHPTATLIDPFQGLNKVGRLPYKTGPK